jgi:demethylmenaquinone methyltransferase / 2-methoxy-6-polyprenyl-1,4-benzoquinol methylase
MPAVPYKNSERSKKIQVEEMFDEISPRYDLLNHLLSVNIDKTWRRKAIELLRPYQPVTIIDIATGTADFAMEAAKLKPQLITGIDLSEGMLKIGRQKIDNKGLSGVIELIKADSEDLPFADDFYDAAIVGFGVRNFENLKKGLAEIFRVLKPGGIFIILEFSRPKNEWFRKLYFLYFRRVLPMMGRLVSKSSRAYSYLPESVLEFPDGDQFAAILRTSGFVNVTYKLLTLGIATIYLAQKPDS